MRSKKGARWAIFTIQDMTGVQELLAFPESFARLEAVLKAGNPLLLKVAFKSRKQERGFPFRKRAVSRKFRSAPHPPSFVFASKYNR